MKKRIFTVLVALAFGYSSLFLLASCAKKEVKEAEKPVAEEAKPEEAKPAKPEVEEEKAKEYKEEEAKRQEKLRKLELVDLIGEKIYFDFDKSVIKPQAEATLKEKAEALLENKSISVLIEGHCDERGTDEYNMALGQRRAYAAKNYLMKLGVSEERLKTISYGEERPADPRHTVEAWAKNRRDEFKVIE